MRELLKRCILEVATAQAQSFSAEVDFKYVGQYPVLQNEAKHTEFCLNVVRHWLGGAGVVPNPEPVPEPASEDFAVFLKKVPDCVMNIGNGVGSVGG